MLTSMPSISMRTPSAIDSAAGSHTWSDRRSSGFAAVFSLVAPIGAGIVIHATCGGLMLPILVIWVVLAVHWVASGAGVVVDGSDGEWPAPAPRIP